MCVQVSRSKYEWKIVMCWAQTVNTGGYRCGNNIKHLLLVEFLSFATKFGVRTTILQERILREHCSSPFVAQYDALCWRSIVGGIVVAMMRVLTSYGRHEACVACSSGRWQAQAMMRRLHLLTAQIVMEVLTKHARHAVQSHWIGAGIQKATDARDKHQTCKHEDEVEKKKKTRTKSMSQVVSGCLKPVAECTGSVRYTHNIQHTYLYYVVHTYVRNSAFSNLLTGLVQIFCNLSILWKYSLRW